LLTMEKTGRLIHVYEDQTKEIKWQLENY
jgi:hypothetical protein